MNHRIATLVCALILCFPVFASEKLGGKVYWRDGSHRSSAYQSAQISDLIPFDVSARERTYYDDGWHTVAEVTVSIPCGTDTFEWEDMPLTLLYWELDEKGNRGDLVERQDITMNVIIQPALSCASTGLPAGGNVCTEPNEDCTASFTCPDLTVVNASGICMTGTYIYGSMTIYNCGCSVATFDLDTACGYENQPPPEEPWIELEFPQCPYGETCAWELQMCPAQYEIDTTTGQCEWGEDDPEGFCPLCVEMDSENQSSF